MTVDTEALLSTVAAAELTTPSHDRLPRVNLLPPEIAERARLRRVQLGLGGGLLTAVGVVAVLYAGSLSSVTDAEGDLASVTSRNAALQADVAELAEVESVYSAAAAAQSLLSQAMGQEVRYSTLLDDLTLTVPDNVWLQDVSFVQSPPPPSAAGAPAAPDVLGTVTFTGTGRSHEDVAAWLESLTAQHGYTQPSFTGATSSLTDGHRTVTFTSTATLTSAALSGRYAPPSGG